MLDEGFYSLGRNSCDDFGDGGDSSSATSSEVSANSDGSGLSGTRASTFECGGGVFRADNARNGISATEEETVSWLADTSGIRMVSGVARGASRAIGGSTSKARVDNIGRARFAGRASSICGNEVVGQASSAVDPNSRAGASGMSGSTVGYMGAFNTSATISEVESIITNGTLSTNGSVAIGGNDGTANSGAR